MNPGCKEVNEVSSKKIISNTLPISTVKSSTLLIACWRSSALYFEYNPLQNIYKLQIVVQLLKILFKLELICLSF